MSFCIKASNLFILEQTNLNVSLQTQKKNKTIEKEGKFNFLHVQKQAEEFFRARECIISS